MRVFRRVCVYCGSHAGDLPAFRESAERLGAVLARRELGLVYGGGNIGLMGALADAVLDHGGEVIGIIPRSLMDKELGHPRLTRLEVVDSMHHRKQRMADLSDAFVALPGGIGTLEETLETFTWLQLGFHHKPLGLLNVASFYDGLLTFLREVVARGFLRSEHLDCLLCDDDPARLLDRLAAFEWSHRDRWWETPARTDPR